MHVVLGGAIEAVFAPLIEALPFIRLGAIKPLALCGLKRSPLLPDVPSMADFLPGYQSSSWNGIMAPARTAPAIVKSMNAALVQVIKQPNVRAHMAEGDKEPVGSSPEEFKKFIAEEVVKLPKQVEISGAKME